MTLEQFKDIKNRAWAWYRGNMLEWAVKSIKGYNFAPNWVQEELKFDMPQMVKNGDMLLNNDDFIKKHNGLIDKLLLKSQKRNFKVNYTKELLEYYEADRDSDEYEKIDALCDMIVVCVNAGGILSKSSCSHYTNALISAVAKNTSKESRREILNKINGSLTNPLSETCDSIEYLILSIVSNGYDPYLCLLETIKELESRTGSWNEEEGKWIKDVGAYTFEEADNIVSKYDTENERELYEDNTEFWRWQLHIKGEYCSFKIKKWYKADYSKCKLN